MTKCIVIEETSKREPIVFKSCLDTMGRVVPTESRPDNWGYVELISKDYSANFDIMFAYHEPDKRHQGHIFLGKWNDGIV